MIVGVPTETKTREYRVGINPGGVAALVQAGHRVLIERDAGVGSGIGNADFEGAGATMVDSADFSADFCFVAVNQLSTTTFCSSTALQVYQNQACKYYLCANRANSANVLIMQMCK